MRLGMISSKAAFLFIGASVLTRAASAGDYSTYIKLTGPADKAHVPFDRPEDKVTLAFRMDLQTIASLSRADGSLGNCLLRPSFYVLCKGGGCKAGPAGILDMKPPDTQHSYDVPVSDLLGLTAGPATEHTFEWGAEARIVTNDHSSPPCPGIAMAVARRTFSLVKVAPTPTPGPPDLALSLDVDNAAVWPKKVVLADRGGPSRPTFLTISVKTLFSTDANVKKYCSLMDEQKTHTVVELKHGDEKTFDVPALKPSENEAAARGRALAPATPTPTKGPLKAGLQPTITYHDPNVHQVVGCQYKLDAKLGTDTNVKDPNKQDNSLSRTIRIDVPMN